MKSSIGIRFVQDHALSWAIIVVACVVIVKTCYTKFVQVGLAMTTFVSQGSKIVFSDDDIHSSLGMAGEKVGNFSLYMSSIFWHDNCNNISKHIMGHNVFIFAWATYQMDTQVINGMITLASWNMCNHKM
jgi:hypothetical protein